MILPLSLILANLMAAFGAVQSPPCARLSRAEARATLGEVIRQVIPEAEEPDEETGGLHSSCTFIGATKSLTIAVIRFKSAEEASTKITAQYTKRQDSEDGEKPPVIEPEPGLGDQAWVLHSDRAVGVLMRKGAVAFGAIFGGKIGPWVGYRPALRETVIRIAAKA